MKKLRSRPRKTSVRLFLCLFVSLNLLFVSPLQAQGDPALIARKIEARRGTWITLAAKIKLEFLSESNSKAACIAELLYHRLDEKLLIKGSDPTGRLLFVLKTSDLSYELFLPAKMALYKGNVFDLEQSPEIESHLRALDLYRALKPHALVAGNASVISEKGNVRLQVERKFRGSGLISRKLEVSNEGDIVKETYYTVTEKPAVTIRRADFKTAKGTKTYFPGVINITSYLAASGKTGVKKTLITFMALNLEAGWDNAAWDWQPPANTETFSTQAEKAV